MILGEIGRQVRDLPLKRFQDRTEGFSQAVDGIKGAWPKRALSRDDKLDLSRFCAAPSARLGHLNPSNANEWGSIQRQPGSGLLKDW